MLWKLQCGNNSGNRSCVCTLCGNRFGSYVSMLTINMFFYFNNNMFSYCALPVIVCSH
eukprot:c23187_g1_i4 orf=1127-1300(+)